MLKFVPVSLLAVPLAATALHGCSAAQQAAAGCDGLDVTTSTAQASVLAFSQASADLDAAAARVQQKFLAVCNAMNTELNLPTKTTAAEACQVLHDHVNAVAQAGATVTVTVVPNCHADLSVQASCEASCTATAKCDVTPITCMGGDVVVACNGTCSAQCDVTAPDFQCMGTCEGSCTSDLAVSCQGVCQGHCDAPHFEGTCDAGCTAMFDGKCEGMCNGMCDGTSSTASCAGRCQGTCTGKATGSCMAACSGMFTGGKCEGMCTGSCTVGGGVMCSGKCNGTCKYTPGTATCSGQCHGDCSVKTSPPTCTGGSLNCMGTAECHGDCQSRASATLDCSKPDVTVTVSDPLLEAAIRDHLFEWGEAVSLALQLKDPIARVAGKSVAAFQAIGDVGVAGASCVASTLTVAAHAQASITVSVQASASFQAGS
jgi:hypothetical protein